MSATRLRATAIQFLIIALAARVAAQQAMPNGARVVARILDHDITAQEIGWDAEHYRAELYSNDCSTSDPLVALDKRVCQLLSRDFLEQNKLQATDEEIRAKVDKMRQFLLKDRELRKRRLEEVRKRLESTDLNPAERQRLEKSKAIFERSEDSEKEYEKRLAGIDPEIRAKSERDAAAFWIEIVKVKKALYEKYGGAVVVGKFGPSPVGALKALAQDYQKQGRFVILDPVLNDAYWKMLSAEPKDVLPPDEINFTP